MGNVVIKIVSHNCKNDYHNRDALENVIRYILRESSRKSMNIWGVIGTNCKDKDGIIKCFRKVKKIYHKTDGVQIKHIVVSFKVQPILPKKELVKKIKKTAGLFGDGFQTVYALHENKDNWHIHLGINSVGYDGKKININNRETRKIKKKIQKIWKEVE